MDSIYIVSSKTNGDPGIHLLTFDYTESISHLYKYYTESHYNYPKEPSGTWWKWYQNQDLSNRMLYKIPIEDFGNSEIKLQKSSTFRVKLTWSEVVNEYKRKDREETITEILNS